MNGVQCVSSDTLLYTPRHTYNQRYNSVRVCLSVCLRLSAFLLTHCAWFLLFSRIAPRKKNNQTMKHNACKWSNVSTNSAIFQPHMLHSGDITRAFPFFATLLFLLTLSPTSFLSHFSPPCPFLIEVNKRLSYRGQNAFSVIKHTNAITKTNMYRPSVFIRTSV